MNRKQKKTSNYIITAWFSSQEEILWCVGSAKASQVGVCETNNMEVLLFQEMCSHCGHQSHRWLSVKQDHEGQHA